MLTQKLILSYSTKIISQFLQILATIVVARIAGPSVLGTVAFGLAYVQMYIFISDLGLGTAHLKLVSEGYDLGECIATYRRLKIITTGLYLVVILIVFVVQKYILRIEFESREHEYVIFFSLLMVAMNSILKIPQNTFSARIEQAKLDVPVFARTVIFQILRILVVLLGFGAIALAFSNLIATISIIPIILYFFKDYTITTYNSELAKKYIKIALPVILIGFSTSILSSIDKVLLQFFTNSEQVGYYAAGFRIGGFILLIATSVNMLFFPLFSKAIAQKKFDYVKEIIEKFESFSFLFIMPIVILLAVYSESIITLILGSQYSSSIHIMTIITISMFIMVLNMPYGSLIEGMGYFKLSSVINLINLVFFVGISVVLIKLPIKGSASLKIAAAVLLSKLFLGTVYRIIAQRKAVYLNIKSGNKYIVFGIINFSVFYYLYYNLPLFQNAYFKFSSIIIYIFTTYLFLYIFKMIDKENLKYLTSIIDIKSVVEYIKYELRKK